MLHTYRITAEKLSGLEGEAPISTAFEVNKRWPGKPGHRDKWIFCLTAETGFPVAAVILAATSGSVTVSAARSIS